MYSMVMYDLVGLKDGSRLTNTSLETCPALQEQRRHRQHEQGPPVCEGTGGSLKPSTPTYEDVEPELWKRLIPATLAREADPSDWQSDGVLQRC
jgi:hypothetical protein